MGEYEVKAAFLYNFTKFVEWPEETSNSHSQPMLICVLGNDPFGDSLDKIVAGKFVNGRALNVRRVKSVEEARPCQICFISSSESSRLRSILADLRGASVLTVGDTPGFAEMGGMINLVLQDNHVHFEINAAAAQRVGLKISSRLLNLAKIVKTKGADEIRLR